MNSLTTLISSEGSNADLLQVLSNPDLGASMKNEVPEIVDWIFHPESGEYPHLVEVMDTALSYKQLNEEIDFRHRRNAANILASVHRSLSRRLAESDIFSDKINEFMESEEAVHPELAGHFARIVETVVIATQGTWLSGRQNLIDFLAKNIHIAGYQQLLGVISIEYLKEVDTEMSEDEHMKKLIYSLLPGIRDCSEKCVHSVHMISNTCKTMGNYSHIDTEVVEAVLECISKTKDVVLRMVCWRLLRISAAENPQEDHVFVEWKDRIEADKINLMGGLGLMGTAWMNRDAVELFFSDTEPNTELGTGFLSNIDKMSNEELAKFVDENDIVKTILLKHKGAFFLLDGFQGGNVNGFIVQLSLKLLNRGPLPSQTITNNSEFDQYLVEFALPWQDVTESAKIPGDTDF